jgi:hypothetical protein
MARGHVRDGLPGPELGLGLGPGPELGPELGPTHHRPLCSRLSLKPQTPPNNVMNYPNEWLYPPKTRGKSTRKVNPTR